VIVRIVVQISKTGEKHVTMTQDPITPIQDMLVTSPGWEDSEVIEGRALLLGLDEPEVVLGELVDVELHTAWTGHKPLTKIFLEALGEPGEAI
jgi:hypothetical protein